MLFEKLGTRTTSGHAGKELTDILNRLAIDAIELKTKLEDSGGFFPGQVINLDRNIRKGYRSYRRLFRKVLKDMRSKRKQSGQISDKEFDALIRAIDEEIARLEKEERERQREKLEKRDSEEEAYDALIKAIEGDVDRLEQGIADEIKRDKTEHSIRKEI